MRLDYPKLIKKDNPIGICARSETSGPELEMVYGFVEHVHRSYEPKLKGSTALYFLEPRLDSGYPDLVMAICDTRILRSSPTMREALGETDYKIASYLFRHRKSSAESISRALGFSVKDVELSLELLRMSDLAAQSGRSWALAAKSSFFGLRQLISFEAKIAQAGDALAQAFVNRRFSSLSYILIDSREASAHLRLLCQARGVGIVADAGLSLALQAQKAPVPFNHLTLRFNDWAAKAIAEGDIVGSSRV